MVTITRFLSKTVVPLLAALLVGGCYTQLATVQSEGEDEAYEPTVTDSTAVEPEDDYGTSSTQVYFHYYYPSSFVFAGGYCDPWYSGWPAYDPYYWGPYYSTPFVGIWIPVYPYSYYHPYYYPPYPAPYPHPHDGGYAYGSGYGERRTFGNSRGGGGSRMPSRISPVVQRTGDADDVTFGRSASGATIARPVSSGEGTKPVTVSRPTKVSTGKGARTQSTNRGGNNGRIVKEPSVQQRPSPAGQEKGTVGRGGSERSGQSPAVQAPPRSSPPPSHSGSGNGGGGRGGSPRGGRR